MSDHDQPIYSRVPGLRDVDHVAFTVPDLEQAVRFFVEVFACREIYRVGPTQDPDGDWMQRRLNVHPRASLHFAMLRSGPHLNMELYEWSSPARATTPPRNSDVGASHLAFFVDDIERATEALRAQPGVQVLEGVERVPDGPIAGTRWVYFLTPWMMQLELVSYGALPYETATAERQHAPAGHWEAR